MPAPALFGIENDAANTVVNLLVLFLVVLWLALVFWTYADAKRRIADPLVVACATAASVFPFLGTIVYLILRPPEYLEDVHERQLEIAAAEARLLQLHELSCPHCGTPAERTFLRCPRCLRRLKEPCSSCRRPLDPQWRICPYCEAEVGEATPQRRRRRVASASSERAAAPGRAARAARTAPQETRSVEREAPPAASPGLVGPDGSGAEERTVARPRPSAG
jgi:hypothetical protein